MYIYMCERSRADLLMIAAAAASLNSAADATDTAARAPHGNASQSHRIAPQPNRI